MEPETSNPDNLNEVNKPSSTENGIRNSSRESERSKPHGGDAADFDLDKVTRELPGNGAYIQTSHRTSSVSDKMLSRMHTMLRSSSLSGSGSRPSSKVKSTVTKLSKEKTQLDLSDEDDEEMKSLFGVFKKDKEPTDSDYDTDLEDEEETVSLPDEMDRKSLYQKTCKKLGVRPIPNIEGAIESKHMEVMNKSLNAIDVLAMCNVLISNHTVTHLILDDNKIGDDGAQVIAWLMKDKATALEKLSLSNNGIGPTGFKALAEMLMVNRQLTILDIAGNDAGDEHVSIISKALRGNTHLAHINLSCNNIGDKGAKALASALANNEGLHSLDLSWNKIQPSGGAALCHALRENVLLKSLNLSMNGLSTQGSAFLGETLKKNDTLTYLNITYNRIFDEGALHIAKGLQVNERLHNLIMHNNPLTSVGVTGLLAGIIKNENTGMWKLDVHTVPIVKELVKTYEEYHTKNEGFELRHGSTHDTEAMITGQVNALSNRNPMAMVREFIENEGLRLIDFFRLMDTDRGGSITKEEFIEGLEKCNVKMTQAQLNKLIKMLDKDGDGEIDFGELVEGDHDFRRKLLKKKLAAMKAFKELAATKIKPEDSWVDED